AQPTESLPFLLDARFDLIDLSAQLFDQILDAEFGMLGRVEFCRDLPLPAHLLLLLQFGAIGLALNDSYMLLGSRKFSLELPFLVFALTKNFFPVSNLIGNPRALLFKLGDAIAKRSHYGERLFAPSAKQRRFGGQLFNLALQKQNACFPRISGTGHNQRFGSNYLSVQSNESSIRICGRTLQCRFKIGSYSRLRDVGQREPENMLKPLVQPQ